MECERYQVNGSAKTDISIHRFEMNKIGFTVRYQRTSGRPWLIDSPATLTVSWSSSDGLRAVAIIVANPPPEQRLLGPVYVADLDFGRPRLRLESFGGTVDLDEVVNDPWRIECRRLN
jgi:hypothetical protein